MPAPSPFPPISPSCNNQCPTARDGDCDDGGPGAEYSYCPFDSDCADCTPPTPDPSPLPSPSPNPAPTNEDDIDLSSRHPKFKTVTRFTISGEVSMFTPDVKQRMIVAFAGAVGVSYKQVEIFIVAASVEVTYDTYSSSQASMVQVKAAVSQNLGSQGQMSQMLQLINMPQGSGSVESSVVISTEVAPEEGGSNVGVIVGAVLGGLGGVALVAFVAIFLKSRSSEPMKKPVLKVEHVINENRENTPRSRKSKGNDKMGTELPPSYAITQAKQDTMVAAAI